jgi:phage major head subunit gpT-like protein
MPITTSHFGKALWPGINKWYGKAYDEFSTEYTEIFDKFTSGRAYEEDVGTSGLGLAAVQTQGNSVIYDEEQQGFITRYQHVTYGLGFIITQEMYEDDQYDIVGERRGRGLAFSMRQTKEIVAANVLNRAFTSTYAGGDGKEMCATDHPNVAGGTYKNELTTAADLSEASLEQACIDLMDMKNDRGLRIAIMPQKLIVPKEELFNAERILKTEYTVGSADNDLNVVRNKFPGGLCVNHYLSDADAWFIKTNCPDGLKYFERRADTFSMDNDFDTDNAKYKATGRYSFGWTDPRGIFGSPGA